jgi:iron complex outermembrane receptor protein
MDGKYTSFHNATSAGADYTGNTTENTPKYSVNLGADLKLPAWSGEWVVAPQLSYIGETYLQPDNLPFNTQGGYLLASARAGFDWRDGRYGLYAWGKNLTNARYKEFTRQFSGSDQVLWGEPLTYGVQFVAHF